MNLDTYEDFTSIDKPEGEIGVEQGTVTHVFTHSDHGRVTVYETVRGDFVGVHEVTDTETDYYRIDPAVSIEMSTLPLMDDKWELEEFDSELATQRIQDMIRKGPTDNGQ